MPPKKRKADEGTCCICTEEPASVTQDRKCPLCRTVMLFPLKTGGLPSEPFIASQADRGLTFAAEQNEKESDALGVYQALKGVFRLIPEESRDRWFEVLEATCDQLEDDEGQSAINTLVGLILESKDEVNVPGLEIILEQDDPLDAFTGALLDLDAIKLESKRARELLFLVAEHIQATRAMDVAIETAQSEHTAHSGIVAVIAAMRSYERIASVQARGCERIASYSCQKATGVDGSDDGSDDDAEAKKRSVFLGAAGAVEVAVAALRAHPTDAGVARQACEAIFQILWDYDSGQSSTVPGGGGVPAAVIATLGAHSTDTTVLQGGAGALWTYYIGLTAEDESPVPHADTLRALVQLLRSKEADVVEEAAGAVRNVLVHFWRAFKGDDDNAGDDEDDLRDALGVDLLTAIVKDLVAALRGNLTAEGAKQALYGIANCTANSTPALDIALGAGLFAAVSSVMRTHGKTVAVVKAAFYLLKTLFPPPATNEVLKAAATKAAGVVKQVKDAMKAFPEDAAIQGDGKILLGKLGAA